MDLLDVVTDVHLLSFLHQNSHGYSLRWADLTVLRLELDPEVPAAATDDDAVRPPLGADLDGDEPHIR